MASARPLHDLLAGLAGEASDPAEVLREGGHADLPDGLLAEAIVSYADTAPAEVAEHLAPFVTAHSAVPTGDPDGSGGPAVAQGLRLVATAPAAPSQDAEPAAGAGDPAEDWAGEPGREPGRDPADLDGFGSGYLPGDGGGAGDSGGAEDPAALAFGEGGRTGGVADLPAEAGGSDPVGPVPPADPEELFPPPGAGASGPEPELQLDPEVEGTGEADPDAGGGLAGG